MLLIAVVRLGMVAVVPAALSGRALVWVVEEIDAEIGEAARTVRRERGVKDLETAFLLNFAVGD